MRYLLLQNSSSNQSNNKNCSTMINSHSLALFLNLLFLSCNIATPEIPKNVSTTQEFINKEKNMNYSTLRWPNGSSIIWYPNFRNASAHSSEIIDCFGIGKTAANGLEWFFDEIKSNSVHVRFFMSSRNHQRVEVTVGRQFGLEWTDFVIERRTIIIVHGFLSNGQEDWIRRMEEAFYLWGDVNVIIVDWSAHGNTWNYYKAAFNAKIVGHQISKFLSHIVNKTRESTPNETSWGSIHMVGHSLGAHICGLAANDFKKITTSWVISRITGLDPAQPCFTDNDLSLDKGDAAFVDVIHTNGKLFSNLGLGLPDPIGHMDFYPNGGKRQPACMKIPGSAFDYLGIPKSSIQQAICSHGLSYVYFTESIISSVVNNCSYCSHSWDRTYRHAQQIINGTAALNICVEMGLRADKYSFQGTFFVLTSSTTPYCDVRTNDVINIRQQLREDFADNYQD